MKTEQNQGKPAKEKLTLEDGNGEFAEKRTVKGVNYVNPKKSTNCTFM